MSKAREIEFDLAMFEVYRKAKTEFGYNATRFFQMLEEHRDLETTRILLHSPTVSDGYVALWERGRLDLTVEALVTSSNFRALFTSHELEVAEQRLQDYGYGSSTVVGIIGEWLGVRSSLETAFRPRLRKGSAELTQVS